MRRRGVTRMLTTVRFGSVAVGARTVRPKRPKRPLPGVARHGIFALVTILLVGLVAATRGGWDPMHIWNRAFADVSLLLLVVTLAAGPLTRVWSGAARLVLWRRELGIWSVFTAVGHVLVVLTGWVEWEPLRLFYNPNPVTRAWALDPGFALGNVLGIVALAYGLVLLATSNDASVRRLGGSTWKFIQQGVYVMYMLVALHTAYFLFFHFVSPFRPPPPPNWLQGPFFVLVSVLLALQTAGLLVTVLRRRGTTTNSDGGNRPEPT